MSTPWNPPDGEAPPDAVLPAALKGTSPTDVARHVFDDFMAHLAGYFLAGTSYVLVVLGGIFVAVVVMLLGVVPGVVTEDETVAFVGSSIGFVLYMAIVFFLGFVAFPAMIASLLRGLDKQQRGLGTLGFSSPFNDLSGSGRAIAFYLLSQVLVLVGVVFCYLPGLVVATLSSFALPIVVLEGASPTEALGLGWRHMRSDPGWHLAVWLLMVVALLALELTLIGALALVPAMAAWQLFAYRAAFGPDGARAWAAARDATGTS